MNKPIEIGVRYVGITHKAQLIGKGGHKLSCTSTGGNEYAAKAWVDKFYGPNFEAVKTDRHHNGDWDVYECRRKYQPATDNRQPATETAEGGAA